MKPTVKNVTNGSDVSNRVEPSPRTTESPDGCSHLAHVDRVREAAHTNRRLTVHETAAELNITTGSFHTILTEQLQMILHTYQTDKRWCHVCEQLTKRRLSGHVMSC